LPVECPAGAFRPSSSSTGPGCVQCGPGRWGQTANLAGSLCSGPCTAGYACPAGSTSATALECAVGRYSLQGMGECMGCAAGRYGSSAAATNASCSGPCTAGYACPAGSTNATALECAAGQYSLHGMGECITCPSGRFSEKRSQECTGCAAGRYGSSAGATNASCSGPCTAGFTCDIGSSSPMALPCAAGRFSDEGARECSLCPSGKFSFEGMGWCVVCAAGHFGSRAGMANAFCSGPCSAGYACVAGSTNATALLCLAGRYSEAGAGQCTLCPAGQYSASPGQVSCSSCACMPGWTCAVGATLATGAPCPEGTSSAGGGTQCVLVVGDPGVQVLPWALAGACLGLALLGVAWALRLQAQRRKDCRPESRVVPVCDNVRVVSVGTKAVYSLEESEHCQTVPVSCEVATRTRD
jgi:hypothetical protein